MENTKFPSMVQLAQEWLLPFLHPGAVAVDATMGNGGDTLFLAQQVGSEGQVYAFDVNPLAVQRTRAKLEQAGQTNVRYIQSSHENLGQVVNRPIQAAMFNLGYLPGGEDKRQCTRAVSTLGAVAQAVYLLAPRGALTVCAYVGHPGGADEHQLVREFLCALPASEFQVLNVCACNQVNAPVLYAACRR